MNTPSSYSIVIPLGWDNDPQVVKVTLQGFYEQDVQENLQLKPAVALKVFRELGLICEDFVAQATQDL